MFSLAFYFSVLCRQNLSYRVIFFGFRNVLHILMHMWPDRPVCGKAGTRDQGAEEIQASMNPLSAKR
jgi:hypothetical protein